jgi:uncharacterized membrane protein
MPESDVSEGPVEPDHERPPRSDDALDKTFHVALALKGLDGLLELLGGLFLVIVSPDALNRWAHDITQHELSENPHSFIANHLLHITQNLHHTQLLGALYLISHGAAKVIMVVGLWLEKGWAYPFAFIFLTLFIAAQLYELTLKFSIGVVLLTVFDAFILWLTWREYRRRKDGGGAPAPDAPSVSGRDSSPT